MTRTLLLSPKKIAKILCAIVAFLLTANLASIFLKFVIGKNYGFIRTFYFNGEANVPAFYSTLAILLSGLLLLSIGNLKSECKRGQSLSWKILGYIFIFLALDEFLSIHEGLTTISRNMIGGNSVGGGYLNYAWVIPYCILFGGIFVILTKFFLRLPNTTKIQFFVSAFIFLSGAVGLELIGGRHETLYGTDNLSYSLLVTLEEFLEMAGIIIFIYALTSFYVTYAENNILKVNLTLSPDMQSKADTIMQNQAKTEMEIAQQDIIISSPVPLTS